MLHRHLAEIDQACNERMEIIVSDMAKQEGVTEVLKAADQMEWMLECFFVYPVRGIEPDGAQVLLCAIMERCVFGCILDMKIPPELSELFLCLL